METWALPLIATIAIGTAGALVKYWIDRKTTPTEQAEEYADQLTKTNATLIQRIEAVEQRAQDAETKAAAAEARARRLADKVSRLERTVAHLAEENDYLRDRLKMPPRNKELVRDLYAEANGDTTDGI